MIVIGADNLSLSFGTKKILDGVTFSLNEGDHLGIVGVNGCGKSTLFRLLLGEYEPDTGSVYRSKDTTVGVLRQDGAFEDFSGDAGEATCLEVMVGAFPELLSMERRLASLEDLLRVGCDGARTVESLAAEYAALNDRFLRGWHGISRTVRVHACAHGH